MESMTGYGYGLFTQDDREISVEIKTVNHRFLDLSFRMPRNLSFLEEPLRILLTKNLIRGHADILLTYRNQREDARNVTIDIPLLKAYQAALHLAKDASGLAENVTLSQLVAYPDVMKITEKEEDQQAVTTVAIQAAMSAIRDVCAMRKREGEALKDDLTVHLDSLESIGKKIESLAPGVPTAYRDRLTERLKELRVDTVDPARIEQEVALYADKCAIDEELSRLKSHITQVRTCLEEPGETGRKLDFLVQEMNREVNTIGSKACDTAITTLVVAAKSEIEKLREQVQNVA